MVLDRKELKAQAREAMRLTRPSFWLVALSYLLLTGGVSALIQLIPGSSGGTGGTFAIFLSIALSLYTVILDFGFVLWSLWTHRRLDPGMDSLIQGFSVAGRVIWMHILVLLRLMCWTFAITFGTVMLSMFIADDPMQAVMTAMPVAYIAMYAVSLNYVLSDYLLADHPDLGPAVAIHRSVRVMKGWRFEWFKLDLSFLGWSMLVYLLEAVAFAVCLVLGGFDLLSLPGMSVQDAAQTLLNFSAASHLSLLSFLFALPVQLWLLPYRGVTFAAFYDALLKPEAGTEMTDPFGSLEPPAN